MQARILVVDDNKQISRILSHQLSSKGFKVIQAFDGYEALDMIYMKSPDLIILDIRLPKIDGFKVAIVAKEVPISKNIPIIILTGSTLIGDELLSFRLGATYYIQKPYVFKSLLEKINACLEDNLSPSVKLIPEEYFYQNRKFGQILTRSEKMLRVISKARSASEVNLNCLIIGETGTGKNLLAREIHSHSSRKDNPFVEVHCGQLPESLVEAELFGYEKGAFTGADHTKRGKFELADKGTILLDDVSTLSPRAQATLLKICETKRFCRLGGEKDIEVDVRIIATSNQDLSKDVEAGKFRKDLYYRFKELTIELPTLCERKQDMPELIEHFVTQYNQEFGKQIIGVSRVVLSYFMKYSWPGNIRELKNMIGSAMTQLNTGEIWLEDMPALGGEEIKKETPAPFFAGPLKEVEKKYIKFVLEKNHWNKSETARELGISRSTLDRKIKEYDITP
jgi:two-component system NtrC family response regulator